MSNTLKFKIFCIEQYKNEHNLSGEDVVKLFKNYGIFDYLSEFYDVLHSFGAKYIVEDIDLFIKARS
jgi:hypothetical protein